MQKPITELNAAFVYRQVAFEQAGSATNQRHRCQESPKRRAATCQDSKRASDDPPRPLHPHPVLFGFFALLSPLLRGRT